MGRNSDFRFKIQEYYNPDMQNWKSEAEQILAELKSTNYRTQINKSIDLMFESQAFQRYGVFEKSKAIYVIKHLIKNVMDQEMLKTRDLDTNAMLKLGKKLVEFSTMLEDV